MKSQVRIWSFALLALCVAAPVHAGVSLDWDPAYFWQAGATPTNAPAGGEMKAVGIISSFGPPLEFLNASDPSKEYTFYIHGLISQGTVATGPPSTTFYVTSYTGGFIELYEDLTPESSFAPNPPNATVPSTYTDGTLLLSGVFTSFHTQTNNFSSFSVGNAEGTVLWTGGSLLSYWANNQGDPCPGLFNGGTTWHSTVVPAGYLFRHDGKMDLNCYNIGDLDIHPTSCPNPINVDAQGLTPVALLGGPNFDIAKVELQSLRLQGVKPVKIALGDVSRPVSDPKKDCDCTTEGADGYDDLVLKFKTQDLVAAIGGAKSNETRKLTLTGNLFWDGTTQPFKASDCVRLIVNDEDDDAPASAPALALEVTMPGAGLVPARIDYQIEHPSRVQISVLDVTGRSVARLVDTWQTSGKHSVEWSPRGMQSGVYFVRMLAGDEMRVRRVSVMR